MQRLLTTVAALAVIGSVAAVTINCDVPRSPAVVAVHVSDEMEPLWGELIARYPLPVEFEYRRSDAPISPAVAAISFEITDWTNRGRHASSPSGTAAQEAPFRRSVVQNKEFFAPVRELWDPVSSIELAALDEEMIMPLRQILLPQRAIAVDGLWADHPRYPLVREWTIEIAGEDAAAWRPLFDWLAAIPPASDAAPQIARIGGVGDIMVQRGVESTFFGRADGLERVFNDTLPILQAHDYLIGNLEGAVTRRTAAFPKTYTFRFDPRSLDYLKRAGFDYLSVTNNHAYDYLEAGFIDTLEALERAAIATSGAGRTPTEAATPTRVTVKGQPITILSVGAFPTERTGFDGVRHAMVRPDRAGMLFWGPEAEAAVKEAFGTPGSFNILKVHGGFEWDPQTARSQRELYRRFVQLGADLVLGSHPHVLQGMEGRDGALIAYSLGNFIFPGMGGMAHAEDSVILTVGVYEGAVRYVEPTMVRIEQIPVFVDHNTAARERLFALSRRVQTQ